MKKLKETHEIFWIKYIKDVAGDTFDGRDKEWMAPAVASHCRSYAKLTGRSPKNIQAAIAAIAGHWKEDK